MDDAERESHRVRERVLEGRGRVPSPRSEVAASWRRVAARGVDPGGDPRVSPLAEADLERRRAASGLAPMIPRLAEALAPVLDTGQMMVVADTEGRVLWRRGANRVLGHADRLGFVLGSAWTEGNVGTNAIGTSLVVGEGVHIRGAEHFVETHTPWGCAAAPLTDPWTGRTLGVLDVSGPSRSLHPAELALVTMAARLSALERVEGHREDLEQLRAQASALLSGQVGPALVVDRHGHVALAQGLEPPGRLALPSDMGVGEVWLPSLGAVSAEALPGGWMLRLAPGEATVTRLVLDLRAEPAVEVAGGTAPWSRRLTPRHAEIIAALVRAGAAGRTAGELAADLFDDPGRVVTVRAEMSRLRRILGGVLQARPYRIAPSVETEVVLPDRPSAVLPLSSAPVAAWLRGGCPTAK